MGKRTTPRLQIVLNFIQMSILELLEWAQITKNQIDSSPDIAAPVVDMTDVQNHIDILQGIVDARQLDQSTVLTTDQATAANVVYNDFTYLAGQAEMIANQKIEAAGGDYNAGLSFVGGLNFTAKNISIRGEQVFEVMSVSAPGKASLSCPFTEGSLYAWRFSKTPSTGWSAPVATRVTKINFTELDGDTRYWFQYAAVANVGKDNSIDASDPEYAWSDPISALIPGNPA